MTGAFFPADAERPAGGEGGDGPPPAGRGPFDDLPGDLMMWVLIVSELLVFGAGLAAFLAVRLTDPAGFAEAQSHLHRSAAGVNTVVLVTSGWLAALALSAAEAGQVARVRALLVASATLGLVFLALKSTEYAAIWGAGIGFDTHPFFTFHILLTGFHAAHVGAGMILLLIAAIPATPRATEVGAAFWHMVDLVWVLLFPVIYLI